MVNPLISSNVTYCARFQKEYIFLYLCLIQTLIKIQNVWLNHRGQVAKTLKLAAKCANRKWKENCMQSAAFPGVFVRDAGCGVRNKLRDYEDRGICGALALKYAHRLIHDLKYRCGWIHHVDDMILHKWQQSGEFITGQWNSITEFLKTSQSILNFRYFYGRKNTEWI